MARGEWVYTAATKGVNKSSASNAKSYFAGFRWKYENTLEDAKATNRDLIRVEPYVGKDDGTQTPSQLVAWKNMNLCCTYGGSTTKIFFERRVWYSNGSNGTKYYLSPTKTYDWRGGKSHDGSTIPIAVPMPPYLKSNGYEATNRLTLYSDTGNCGYTFECPHNEDGTPKSSVTIFIEDRDNANSGLGLGGSFDGHKWALNPKATFTLDKIDRGTKIWRKESSGWSRNSVIHFAGEAAGAQHYIYKKTNSGWEKIYG